MIPLKLKTKVLAFLGYWGLKFLWVTLRWRFVKGEDYFEKILKDNQGIIILCWHNDLLFLPFLYRFKYQQKNLKVLVSKSSDGQLIAYVLDRLDVKVSWGSSSRDGTAGFRGLQKFADNEGWVSITPDGPKGPRHHVHSGMIRLAKISQKPILPVAYDFNRKWEAGSWDRMKVPYPFAKGRIAVGELFYIPEDMSESDEDKYKIDLKKRLDVLEDDLLKDS